MRRDADITVSHEWPPHFAAPASSRYVHYQPWEYGSMPRDWFDALRDDCDDLWMPSSYNRNRLSRRLDSRQHVLPSYRTASMHECSPRRIRTARTDERFRFLFVGGTIFRKGIDVLIEAYVRAFQGRRDVVLTIKDVNTRQRLSRTKLRRSNTSAQSKSRRSADRVHRRDARRARAAQTHAQAPTASSIPIAARHSRCPFSRRWPAAYPSS